jgi:hypothetical protein
MRFTRGRRHQVDETTNHFCPHAACSYHGWVSFGNIRANGHPNGRRYFLEMHGTPLHCKQVEPDK